MNQLHDAYNMYVTVSLIKAWARGLGLGFQHPKLSLKPAWAGIRAQLSSGFEGSAAQAFGLWAKPCKPLVAMHLGQPQVVTLTLN